MVPLWLQAGGWGLLAGSALLLGAFIAYKFAVPRRAIAGVTAFGSGVLISALAFELMDEAFRRGGFMAAAAGFLGGAISFTGVTLLLNGKGGKHRKRSQGQPTEKAASGSGLAIAAGALLDGVPESMVIGVSLLEGGAVSIVAVVAIFLSNIPEGLSSVAGMKAAGRSARYIFGVWGAIALSSGFAAAAGNVLLTDAAPEVIAATTTFAAGAILAMLADTMIPEAFEEAHDYTGLITVAGFLVSFALSKVL